MDEQSEEGDDVFSMSNFYFMPIGTKLSGDKIKDTFAGELQEELEEEEKQVPLQGKTWLARAIGLQRRKSATGTSLSTQVEPLELSSSEDEVK